MSINDLNINGQILDRCKNGEVKAQFILYKQYSKAMYNIAIRFLNNKMDAEDILQESFVTAFEKLGELSNYNAIKDLPTGGRTILVLHALEGYKHREIAEMLGVSESTSKSQYRRALDLLFSQLKQKIYVS